jgi:hypothetical protein
LEFQRGPLSLRKKPGELWVSSWGGVGMLS